MCCHYTKGAWPNASKDMENVLEILILDLESWQQLSSSHWRVILLLDEFPAAVDRHRGQRAFNGLNLSRVGWLAGCERPPRTTLSQSHRAFRQLEFFSSRDLPPLLQVQAFSFDAGVARYLCQVVGWSGVSQCHNLERISQISNIVYDPHLSQISNIVFADSTVEISSEFSPHLVSNL